MSVNIYRRWCNRNLKKQTLCSTYVFSRNKVSTVFAVAERHTLNQLRKQLYTHKSSTKKLTFSNNSYKLPVQNITQDYSKLYSRHEDHPVSQQNR